MADDIMGDVVIIGGLAVAGTLGWIYKDEILKFLKIGGGNGNGGCVKTCLSGQHLDTSTCSCIPNSCTKTCQSGQHIDATCTCVPNPIDGGGGANVKFAAAGDFGTGRHAEPSVSVAKMVKSQGCKLFVGCGDYSYSSASGFKAYVQALGGVPGIWSQGNHDGNDYLSFFHQASWVFRKDVGNCTFISLNGNSFGSSPKQLDTLLKSSPPKKWKIVFFHQPIRSPSSSHGQAKDPGIGAVMKKYGVQLCIQAHNHIYARFPKDSNGVTFMVNGTGGESAYSVGSANGAIKTNSGAVGATIYQTSSNSIQGHFQAVKGSFSDSFTIT